MSRKDFQAMAAALKATKPEAAQALWQWRQDVMAVADVLAASNPRFDHDRFFRAAGAQETPSVKDLAKALTVPEWTPTKEG